MSKGESKKTLQELLFLAALEKAGAQIDTSDIPEVLDWSRAVVGKFYHASVKKPSRVAKLLSGTLRVLRLPSENRTADALEDSKALKTAAKLLSAILRVSRRRSGTRTANLQDNAQIIESAVIDQMLKRVSRGSNLGRDEIISWLFYERGYTVEEIVSLPSLGLTTKEIESILRRRASSEEEIESILRRLSSELEADKKKPTQ